LRNIGVHLNIEKTRKQNQEKVTIRKKQTGNEQNTTKELNEKQTKKKKQSRKEAKRKCRRTQLTKESSK
jgi:hypothetical protein